MNTNSPVIDHFTNGAMVYDERNRQLAPIADNMHFLIRLILKNAPEQARILSVGVGTGAEIISLSKSFPHWTFVGVDPSIGMLDVCRERLIEAGVRDRCELIHGYVEKLGSSAIDDGSHSGITGESANATTRNAFRHLTSRNCTPAKTSRD